VVIVPKEDGPNSTYKLDAQSGQLKERKFTGSGSDTDIITSSARAYVTALNKLLQWQMRRIEFSIEKTNEDSGGIGNAVPVSLGKAIGKLIVNHALKKKIKVINNFRYSRYVNTSDLDWSNSINKKISNQRSFNF